MPDDDASPKALNANAPVFSPTSASRLSPSGQGPAVSSHSRSSSSSTSTSSHDWDNSESDYSSSYIHLQGAYMHNGTMYFPSQPPVLAQQSQAPLYNMGAGSRIYQSHGPSTHPTNTPSTSYWPTNSYNNGPSNSNAYVPTPTPGYNPSYTHTAYQPQPQPQPQRPQQQPQPPPVFANYRPTTYASLVALLDLDAGKPDLSAPFSTQLTQLQDIKAGRYMVPDPNTKCDMPRKKKKKKSKRTQRR